MKLQLKLITQISLIVGLLIILVFNIFSLKNNTDSLNKYKLMASSISRGDRYYGLLQMWYFLAKRGDWSTAQKIEVNLNTVDFIEFKTKHQPDMIRKQVEILYSLKDKNIDDYIHLAQLNAQLGDNKSAFEAIKNAHNIDPIRTDIEKLYFSFLPFSLQ
jgi:hypothetical protein